MRPSVIFALAMLAVCAPARAAGEPVVGGPCQGCEYVFVDQPAQLASRARIAPAGEPGEPLIVEGTVRTLAGAPAEGVIVYAYQTDAGGIYPKGTTRHGRLRAWARTDRDGRYRFETIRPGAYPGRGVPQHIHLHVIEPGRATYYIQDIVFADDPLLGERGRERHRRGRGGGGLVTPERDADGTWHARRDITLGEKIPGYGALSE